MDHARPLPTMIAQYGHKRTPFEINLDDVRLDRIKKLTARYSEIVGRPVSMALIVTHALDLLHDHLEGLNDPVAITVEKLALLGPARNALPHEDHDEEVSP